MSTMTKTEATRIFVVDAITASMPPSVDNRIAYDKSDKKLKIYNKEQTSWISLLSDSVIYAENDEALADITGSFTGQIGIAGAEEKLYFWNGATWASIGGSGLVKDVAANKAAITALQSTVGNASSGLVKDVADNEAAISTLQTTVGQHTESISTIEDTLAEKADTSAVVLKTDIDTAVGASASASDTKVPSTKAVATAIEGIKTSLSNVYTYKGSATYDEIVAKDDAEVGDVWNSTTANGNYPAGTNYAWTGDAWDALGGEVDLSNYYTKGQTDSAISTAVDPISGNVETLQEQVTTITGTTIPGLQASKANVDASNITAEQVASWKTKLGFVTSGDIPQQVQPDWNAASGLGQILNKPNVSGTTDVTIAGSTKIDTQGKISTSNYSVYTIENGGNMDPMEFDNSKITQILCISMNGLSACNYTVGNNSVIEEVIYGGSLLHVDTRHSSEDQIALNTSDPCTLYCTTIQRDMNTI